ncbi:MAG TPA: alpha-glycosidase [Firmicutes bacterium]|nr:alpha-glycosidase [Bacillota bacterium]
MEASSLYHTPWTPYIQGTQADNLRVLLRAKRDDLKAAYVIYGDRYRDHMTGRATMQKIGADEQHDYLAACLALPTGRFKYYFFLEGKDGSEGWYSENGLTQQSWQTRVFQMPHVAALPQWDGPDWVQDAVCYQIFVDRFRNGNTANDPASVSPWNTQPDFQTRLGGDLQGVIDALPYLQSLGATMLYLTPIFKAGSSHKYDTADYYAVDPEFGDLDTLRRLTNQAHQLGMRVILDGVFNHCGTDFFAFRDLLKKGRDSQYRDWFNVYRYPIEMHPPSYETFAASVAEMPKLRLDNPEVRRYFLNVASYWVEVTGIDGWRIDVANEVDHRFMRELRREVRAINPEAYIVGEIWHSAEPWLRGDKLDGVTAYPWRDAALAFFSGWRSDSDWFAGQLTKHYTSARIEAIHSSLNLLGSHDTPRVLELMGHDVNKARLIAAFQMMSPGVPQIYYGDEVGMYGGSDPACRAGMRWDEQDQNQEMLGLYRYLIKIRNRYPALRRGGFLPIWSKPGDPLFAMLRQHRSGNVLCVFNTAWQERDLQLSGRWLRSNDRVEVVHLTGWAHLPDGGRPESTKLSSRMAPVRLRMGPQAACLLVPKRD